MTTVVLRPDGLAGAGTAGLTITGAASVFAAINDSSDASYVTGNTAAAFAYLTMGTTVLPAGAVTVSVALTVRDDSVLSRKSYALRSTPPAYVSGSMTLATTVGSPYAVTLSQAQIDALTLDFSVDTGDITYDIYATLIYATQPSTVVTAPTGVQTISQPTVAWVHTAGSDGGAQTRYHARIFSAAEYGVSGFDPGTSPATWDSGSTANSDNTTVSGVLANSTTYRTYVRTAQTINGAAHWAEWAFSSFTTSFTTSNITSVAVTGDNTLARHRITVTRDSATPNWLTFDVQRSDDAGTTWVAVRGATGATPPGDVWIGYDYEGTNGTAAIFRARASTALVTGAWTTSTAATWTSTDHWLKNLRSPGNNITVEIADLPQRQWGIQQGVNYVVGRADPVVVSGTRQLHAASVSFETYDAATSAALRTLLSSGTVLLQIAPGLGHDNIYLVAGPISDRYGSEQIGSTWRYTDVSYVEVATPVDDGVLATGLTWQDVATSYATWQTLLDTGKTWGDLV